MWCTCLSCFGGWGVRLQPQAGSRKHIKSRRRSRRKIETERGKEATKREKKMKIEHIPCLEDNYAYLYS